MAFVYAFAPVFGTVVGPNDAIATPLNVAPEIAVKPETVMVTLLPDAADAGATIDGAPSTVTVVDAVSTGVLTPALPIVNCSVYVPDVTLAGTTKLKLANGAANEPVLATVIEAADSVTGATSVDPL